MAWRTLRSASRPCPDGSCARVRAATPRRDAPAAARAHRRSADVGRRDHRNPAPLPDATIDLVVGSWNEALAGLLPVNTRRSARRAVARARRDRGLRSAACWRRAPGWRGRHYDLAINLEGDIRSNLLPWTAGAKRRVGFGMAGGGPLLTDVVRVRRDAARRRQPARRSSSAPSICRPARCRCRPTAAALDVARIVLPDRARASARARSRNWPAARCRHRCWRCHTSGRPRDQAVAGGTLCRGRRPARARDGRLRRPHRRA